MLVDRVARQVIHAQRMLSARFDHLFLPPEYRIDGNTCFKAEFVEAFLQQKALVIDVGGGKRPALSFEQKAAFQLSIIGLDISADELKRAPPGIYDTTLPADITSYVGEASADLAICVSLLEHVPNIDKALRGLAGALKPGGVALIFVPCRDALFARLNLLLPQNLKKRLLNWLFPESASQVLGFKAYYDRCVPSEVECLAQKNGLRAEKVRLYFHTGYFEPITPLHILWRLWQVSLHRFVNPAAAESFSMALRKIA